MVVHLLCEQKSPTERPSIGHPVGLFAGIQFASRFFLLLVSLRTGLNIKSSVDIALYLAMFFLELFNILTYQNKNMAVD